MKARLPLTRPAPTAEGVVRRRATAPQAGGPAPAVVLDVLREPGAPLDAATRWYFEPRFGADFGGVRVHTGTRASASARLIEAAAYAVGGHVVFADPAAARAAPSSNALLAHELAHVCQSPPGNPAAGRLEVGPPSGPAETEADRAAEAVAAGRPARAGLADAGAATVHRYVSPLDALDYIGLAWDAAEAVYLANFYHGDDKQLRQVLNLIVTAIDLVMATIPGAGGGGMAMRASSGAGAMMWHALPEAAKLTAAEHVAKGMGWTAGKAMQVIVMMMSQSSRGGGGKSGGEEGKRSEPAGGSSRSGKSDQEQRAGWLEQARGWFKSNGVKSAGKIDQKTGTRKPVFTNNARGADRRYYTVDQKHGEIEVFDARKRHLGSMDFEGAMSKPPDPTRTLEF